MQDAHASNAAVTDAVAGASESFDALVRDAAQLVAQLRAAKARRPGTVLLTDTWTIAAPAPLGDTARLRQELTEWLGLHPTLRTYPVVPLPTLFGLFNRARGPGHCVAPELLKSLCDTDDELVVESVQGELFLWRSSMADNVGRRVVALTDGGRGVTALQAAHALDLPTTAAASLLTVMSMKGKIAVAPSAGVSYYYENPFAG